MIIPFHTGAEGGQWLWAWLPLAIGYAEIHYTFKGVYSFLKHAFPEILADAPHRLEPGVPLPVTVLVKDAHQYPIHLKKIVAHGQFAEGPSLELVLFEGDLPLAESWWYRTFFLKLPDSGSGRLQLDVHFEIEKKGRRTVFRNDNYRGTSHAPLNVLISGEPLPRFPGLVYGDLHTHSNFTSDQVEFGAPLPVLQQAATAIGLDFVAVTDHSYDLDDCEDDYLKNDPRLPKWKRFREEVGKLNAKAASGQAILIPGEEVTVRNARGRNVHFLVLNSPRFFQGTGDGAEKWFKFHSEHSVVDVLRNLPPEAVAVAAHPGTPAPRLEYVLVNRGRWLDKDVAQPGLTGLQIANGAFDTGFEEGLRLWKRALARGEKTFIFAGTDAHGNFNRYRQVGFPFFKMTEMQDQILGEKRTALFVKERTLDGILDALRAGRAFVTDGPALLFEAEISRGRRAVMGEEIPGREVLLTGRIRSSKEFGALATVRLLQGSADGQEVRPKEKVLKIWCFRKMELEATVRFRKILTENQRLYIRLEVTTHTGRAAFSNPIWLSN